MRGGWPGYVDFANLSLGSLLWHGHDAGLWLFQCHCVATACKFWSLPSDCSGHCACCLCWDMQILGKAEFLNPGGSVKDRVALRILQEALVRWEDSSQLQQWSPNGSGAGINILCR